jgi:integrase
MSFRTQEKVDGLRLPEGKTEHWEFDQACTGNSVRLQGRAKVYVIWLPAPKGQRRPRITIGDCAAIPLKEARRRAHELVNAARDGRDIRAERKAAREAAAAKAADTLGRMIEAYLERRAKPRQKPRSYIETERNLRVAWGPLHAHPVDGVTRRDVADQLERIRRERGPTAARNARVYLSGAYAWAVKAGLAVSNPTIGTEAPAVSQTAARALKPEELTAIWNACGDDHFGRIVQLLMIAGQRRDEVAGMAGSELDLERRLWVIPGTRTKNHREHEVPLPDQAIALLTEQRPGRNFVFGRGKGPFSGFSHCKERLDQKIAEMNGGPIKPWRLHDLRHSWSTHAHEIGVEPHIVEAVLNHVSGHRASIAGRYNHALHREQKRKALERFTDWLDGVVTGKEPASNVMALKKAVAS